MITRYFYNQKRKEFSKTCLPSQLNPISTRKREREQTDLVQLTPEQIEMLPSFVVISHRSNLQDLMKFIGRELLDENPHELFYNSLFIACIMEEIWKQKCECLFEI